MYPYLQQIHDLVYHGNGGYPHSDVWNMPIPLRLKSIKMINEYHESIEAERDKKNGILTAGKASTETINTIKEQYVKVNGDKPHVHKMPRPKRPA